LKSIADWTKVNVVSKGYNEQQITELHGVCSGELNDSIVWEGAISKGRL